MNRKCDLCGRDMVRRQDGPGDAEDAYWVCPATPDQHKIATLEKQVAQLLAAAEERTRQINQLKEKLRNPEKRFIDLQSQLRAREADCFALREALSVARRFMPFLNEWTPEVRLIDGVLSATSATVEEIVARIEREALEKAWARLLEAVEYTRIAAGRWEPGIVSKKVWIDGGEPMISARESRFRAAILGEKNP